jgi:hypothetical protein
MPRAAHDRNALPGAPGWKPATGRITLSAGIQPVLSPAKAKSGLESL